MSFSLTPANGMLSEATIRFFLRQLGECHRHLSAHTTLVSDPAISVPIPAGWVPPPSECPYQLGECPRHLSAHTTWVNAPASWASVSASWASVPARWVNAPASWVSVPPAGGLPPPIARAAGPHSGPLTTPPHMQWRNMKTQCRQELFFYSFDYHYNCIYTWI